VPDVGAATTFWRRSLAVGLFSLLSFSSSASTLFVPLGQLTRTSSILSPSLTLGKSGLQVSGQLAAARSGASYWDARGAFPLESSEEARISGWSWGVAAGSTLFSYVPGVILQPSTYYWEIMMGRGTTEFPAGGESGLRGYLEVALRDQRPQRSNELNQALNDTQGSIEEHATSLAIRMGAGSDFAGEGLVDQKAPTVAYQIEGGIYLPMAKYNRLYLTLQVKAQTACGSEKIGCGLALYFLQSSNAEGIGSTAELYRQVSYGPIAQYRWNDKYALTTQFLWNWSVGTMDRKNKTRVHVGSFAPALNVSALIAF
jgi:hypothetical protein